MTKTKDYTKPKAVFLERNKRFILMRKHFFKTQQLAADFLGVTQKIISDIERGVIDVNPSYVDKFVKELHVSSRWYNEGTLPMVTDGTVKPKSTLHDISDLKAKIAQLESQIDRLEKREKTNYKMLQEIKSLLEASEK